MEFTRILSILGVRNYLYIDGWLVYFGCLMEHGQVTWRLDQKTIVFRNILKARLFYIPLAEFLWDFLSNKIKVFETWISSNILNTFVWRGIFMNSKILFWFRRSLEQISLGLNEVFFNLMNHGFLLHWVWPNWLKKSLLKFYDWVSIIMMEYFFNAVL